jgi:hypothetical protein
MPDDPTAFLQPQPPLGDRERCNLLRAALTLRQDIAAAAETGDPEAQAAIMARWPAPARSRRPAPQAAPSPDAPLTLEQVADRLGIVGSDRARSVRRLIVRLGAEVMKLHRRDWRLTPAQLDGLKEAMRCSPSENAARSTTSAARSASVAKPARSKNTLRAAVTAKLRKPIAPSSSTTSAPRSFTVLPGGRPR